MQPVTGSTTAITKTTQLSAETQIAADYQTFLTMLTTQLQNQDPLNPVDSQDFAVQLATFSGVEQQTRTNALLGELSDQFGVLGLSQLSGWVGMLAETTSPVEFDATPLEVQTDIPASADFAELVAYDADGQPVKRQPLPIGSTSVTWDGQLSDGTTVPTGLYRFEVESMAGTLPLASVPASVFSEVSAARLDSGKTMIVLSGGSELNASDVLSLRRP